MFGLPLWELFLFVLGFGFLIFIHEVGHFVVAKLCGVKCTQFAIGFGPAICTWRKGVGVVKGSTEPEFDRRVRAHLASGSAEPASAGGPAESDAKPKPLATDDADRAAKELGLGETEYRLNWLPLGGYVKMLGQEDMDPAARSDHPRSFNNKPASARAAILSAGVVMNLIAGVLFFVAAFMLGVDFPSAVIGGVTPGSPAATARPVEHPADDRYIGMPIGGRVVEIDGKNVQDMLDVRVGTALASPGSTIEIKVRHPDTAQVLTYRVVPSPSSQERLLSAGISPAPSLDVVDVAKGSVFANAGITPNPDEDEVWRLTAIDGQPVDGFLGLQKRIDADPVEPIGWTFAPLNDDGKPVESRAVTVQLAAAPELLPDPHAGLSLFGLAPVTRIARTVEGSAAEEAGIQPGDLVAQLGSHHWPAFAALPAITAATGDAGLRVKVMRGGEIVDLGVVEPRQGSKFFGLVRSGPRQLGILPTPAFETPMLATPAPGTPAAALGYNGGSVVRAVGGVDVRDWAGIQRAAQRLLTAEDQPAAPAEAAATQTRPAGLDLPIEIALNVKDNAVVNASLAVAADDTTALLESGYQPPPDLGFAVALTTTQATNPIAATALGLRKTGQFMAQTYLTVLRLIQGSVKMFHLRGPVGIVDEGVKVAQRGYPYLLFFLGLISVNLAVINFLPIPIVDGGHIVFLIIEKIKGSPVGPKVQTWASIAGLCVIAFIFLTTLYFDVGRLFG